MNGILIAIYISPHSGALPHSVLHAHALAALGLEGDRYAAGRGTFSPNAGLRDLTLIEAEALKSFSHEYGHPLDAAQSRRNLLTRGVRLNQLVGRFFHRSHSNARPASLRAVLPLGAPHLRAGFAGLDPARRPLRANTPGR